MTKTPTLKIKNGLSMKATIVPRWRNLKRGAMVVVAASVLGVGTVGYTYVSVMLDNEAAKKEAISDALEGSGYAMPAATGAIASIIQKDGGVNSELAHKYAQWIFEASIANKVNPLMILSVMSVESKFDSMVVSSGNAIGLMQIIHSWHKEKTTRAGLFDPKTNINVGAKILREYASQSSSDAETLLRYNGSLGAAPTYALKVLATMKRYEKRFSEYIINT